MEIIISHILIFFNISRKKRYGKGSLLLPCPKMPFGIFLLSLKSEFQEKPHFARKVPKNGGKRRKPEKISGFSVGIFFVKTHWRRHPSRNFAQARRFARSSPGKRACRSPSGGNAGRIPLRLWRAVPGALRA